MGKANVNLRGKDILALEYLSIEEIQTILETAKEMKNVIHRDIKKVPALRGKAIVTLFYEPSTRTRSSFELAGKYLGADVINITAGTSSIVKGESLRDTLYTMEAMGVDAIVMRHKAEGAAEYASKVVSPVIINAGDGAHAHPSQGLLNLFTIMEHRCPDGNFKGMKAAILGDILHSLGHILGGLKFAYQNTINQAHCTGEDKEQRNNGLHYGSLEAGQHAVRVAQNGVLRNQKCN